MQCTVANCVSAAGVGLHSGAPIYMTFMPAPPDTGIVFRRVDCRPVKEIPANMAFISDTRLCTTLERHGAKSLLLSIFYPQLQAWGLIIYILILRIIIFMLLDTRIL